MGEVKMTMDTFLIVNPMQLMQLPIWKIWRPNILQCQHFLWDNSIVSSLCFFFCHLFHSIHQLLGWTYYYYDCYSKAWFANWPSTFCSCNLCWSNGTSYCKHEYICIIIRHIISSQYLVLLKRHQLLASLYMKHLLAFTFNP